GDGPAHLRHAGRVGDGEVAGVGQRRLEPGGELATLVRGEDLLEGGLQVVQEGHEGSSWGAVGSDRRAPGPWVRARTCRTATARSRAAGGRRTGVGGRVQDDGTAPSPRMGVTSPAERYPRRRPGRGQR